MSRLQLEDFTEFFRCVNDGFEPFPWQSRLLREVVEKGWPRTIALPTASGKTACLDIALFSLALGAAGAPRRIFFAVDRRVIVAAVYERALKMARLLAQSEPGTVLGRVAESLKALAGFGVFNEELVVPLRAYQLRGGVYRDHQWAEHPCAPMVIATTVDQVGSRMFFRGYGVGPRALPKHAALVANDALIILDEAHCSQPMAQTMRAVERYRQNGQSVSQTPFRFVVMSATPISDKTLPSPNFEGPFELGAEDREHPVLSKRLKKAKPARLQVAGSAKGKNWSIRLAAEMASQTCDAIRKSGCRRVAVMVNRVGTARAAAELLTERLPGADVVLMTGRMRELDRAELLERYSDKLKSGTRVQAERPIAVVATQCLEVGADFDFDGLITECASRDALEQRFGRLHRLGDEAPHYASIVIRADQVNPKDEDPIYRMALTNTWAWLQQVATEGCVDFGVDALKGVKAKVPADGTEVQSPEAPILMPPHLDCWVQTSPRPEPEPDVSLFLRGRVRSSREVRVLWRELPFSFEGNWHADRSELRDRLLHELSFVPPTVAESVPVPISVFRRWLQGEVSGATDLTGDVSEVEEDTKSTGIPALESLPVFRWRGLNDEGTRWLESISEVTPDDVFILPAAITGSEALADFFPRGEQRIWDRGDQAQPISSGKIVLRLSKRLIEQAEREGTTSICAALWSELGKLLYPDDFPNGLPTELLAERPRFWELLRELAEHDTTWRQQRLKGLSTETARLIPSVESDRFPRRWTVLGRTIATESGEVVGEDEVFPDEESLSLAGDEHVLLGDHCRAVGLTARHFAQLAGFSEFVFDLDLAGRLHDLGKLDPRFQAWLCDGSSAMAAALAEPIAKSKGNDSREERARARREAGYPRGKRHEFLSAALVDKHPELLKGARDPELVLHLIAVHHGLARPFPLEVDERGHSVLVRYQAKGVDVEGCVSLSLAAPPAGHVERFWRLVERYGWWRLAYFEALLVCADHLCSRDPNALSSSGETSVVQAPEPSRGAPLEVHSLSASRKSLHLSGLDGSNILAYLAALGVLRVANTFTPGASLSWELADHWTPVLHLGDCGSEHEMCQKLHDTLRSTKWYPPMDNLDNTHKIGLDLYRQIAGEALETWFTSNGGDHDWSDWLCALVGEVDENGIVKDTALRTMSGAGHQHFLKTMRDLQVETTEEHLYRTLFVPWDYQDEKPTLRLDPRDDRRYALRADNPATSRQDPIRTVRGANRLAAEAIPLLPTWPRQNRLETAGFTTGGSRNTYFYWPIWTGQYSIGGVRSLLWQRGWSRFQAAVRRALTIVEVYRSRRITVGKVRNFTPSEPVVANSKQPIGLLRF